MDIRGVKFRVGGEWRVGGLYQPAGPPPTPAVLMLHGFPGVQQNEDMAAELCRRGHTVFLPHFGGCWGSSGFFHVDGLLADARAAFQLLSKYHHVDARRVAVLGYSLGGWAALRLAAECKPAAVLALAPALPREGEAADALYLRKYGRVVNMASVADVWTEYARAAHDDRPEEYIPRIAPAPLLFVSGRRDRLAPASSAARLYALAREPKALLELPDEGHEFQTNRRHVVDEVCSWLEARLKRSEEAGLAAAGARQGRG